MEIPEPRNLEGGSWETLKLRHLKRECLVACCWYGWRREWQKHLEDGTSFLWWGIIYRNSKKHFLSPLVSFSCPQMTKEFVKLSLQIPGSETVLGRGELFVNDWYAFRHKVRHWSDYNWEGSYMNVWPAHFFFFSFSFYRTSKTQGYREKKLENFILVNLCNK